ncbi:MAG: hypothetical protein RL885_16265 [Planctomycetota bacterium]
MKPVRETRPPGHALSARALLESQSDEMALSSCEAVRSLSERAHEAHVQAEPVRDSLVTLRVSRPDEEASGADDESEIEG